MKIKSIHNDIFIFDSSKMLKSRTNPLKELQMCNHQFTKLLDLQIKFDNIAIMLIYTICHYSDRYFNIDRQLDMLQRFKYNGHDN